MSRPLSIPKWGLTPAVRVEPVAGTEDSGYAYGEIPAAKHWNWMRGFAGDWLDYLDKSAVRASDELANLGSIPNRVSPSAIAFLIGGGLAQRPTVGSVYYCGRERIDMRVIAAPDCPLYVFAANSTNYLWVRPRLNSSRSAYPETVINQTGLPPNNEAGWYLIYRNTTNVATVTTQQEESSVKIGFYRGTSNFQHEFRGPLYVTPDAGLNQSAVVIQTRQAFSPGVFILSEAGQTNTLVQASPQSGQLSFYTTPSGADIPGYQATVATQALGFAAFGAGNDSVGFYANMGDTGYPVVIEPTSVTNVAHFAGANANRFRMFVNNVSGTAAGFRWRDASGIDRVWIPWASPGGQVLSYQQNADTGAIAGGAGTNPILVNNVVFKQNHKYVIYVECESNATATWVGTVAVTISINGVANALWNARQLSPVADALNHPWLTTRILYTHVAADTNGGTIQLNVQHGASAGSVNYLAPRVHVEGAWFP